MAWATFSVFENTETLRPECLVKDLYGVSPFFLFSIMMAAAIAMVMIGAVSLSFVVSSLRRACCGRPRATTAGPSVVQSYRERISQQSGEGRRTSIADEHRCGGRPSVSCEHGLGGARASTAVEIDTGSLPPPPSPPPSLGDRADNAVDTMQFMLGVFFSIQVATAWRVAIKLLSRINHNVRNGAAISSYEYEKDGTVTAVLESGERVHGDVLIGADGIWSAVRAGMRGEPAKGAGSGVSYSGYTVFAGELTYNAASTPSDIGPDPACGYKVYLSLIHI